MPFQPLEGRFWRVLAPRWAHAPLSGEGAARFGGRWNPAGMAALYLSADLATAVAEYEQEIGIRPGTFCAYDVRVADVLDLTRPDVLAAFGVDAGAPLAPWKSILLVERRQPPGWDVAERLVRAGAAGALVPSSRLSGGVNLVLWRWNDDPRRRVVAFDPQHDLPRNQASWEQ